MSDNPQTPAGVPADPRANAGAPDHPGEADGPPKNPWLCLMVAGILGLVAVTGLIFIGTCAVLGRPVPSELTMVTIAAASSLPGFLTVVPRGSFGYSSSPNPIRR